MTELPDLENPLPRSMPPPDFSAAFASPSLRWACKKRLRCVHPNDDQDRDPDDRTARSLQCDSVRASGYRRLLRSDFQSEMEEEREKKRKKVCRVELWVSLSRDEIEEDFVWMTGSKPPRKARRKERGSFDHLLTAVFPGAWMPNKISAARYRVAESSDPRKTQIPVLENGN